jgi:prefoldin subunit 5
MTDDDTNHRTVDISTDDPEEAAQSAGDAAAGSNGEPVGEQAAEDTDDPGKAEARRYLHEYDGNVDAAIGALRGELESTVQKLQSLNQRRNEVESRREKLTDTRRRVEAHPMSLPLTQTLGGGISLDVPPADNDLDHEGSDAHDGEWDGVYDRDDLLADLAETRGTLAEQVETLDERIEQTERAAKTARQAMEYIEVVADVQPSSHQPESGSGGDGSHAISGSSRQFTNRDHDGQQ